ncbi:alpha-E domain-containing protein [Puniceicoccales bacterium CK1056]|uniref:Alpha-E domain-containing protein n=1 Tax=Oceanipulchritudo coccoides TaxID=2706888 RepID=A0A6B2LZH6_9BACT|nr:alpha-E domain-containing protein [Oceanipulchritudo coccoides]NDV61177.1 alpha-E domain-containing protein [Oceanipulchritudo coccoides]
MLSRVADSLYWMSRYVERAENISRLLDVNLQLMLDFEGLDDESLTGHWEPILSSSGETEQFQKLYTSANSRAVTEFLTFNPENPNSILSCIIGARENARMVRDQISAEMWEVINDIYHKLRKRNAESIWEQGAYEFYEELKSDSLLFQGLTDATFTHDQGYKFIQVGKYIERADQTSRIIDIKYNMLLPENDSIGGTVDIAQWMAVLRACSAFEAYHHRYVDEVQPWNVAEFLILSPNFPRSIRFCLSTLDYHMRSISLTAESQFSNQAEQLSGRLRSEMIYTSIEEIISEGLHEYIDRVQSRLIDLHKAILECYVYQPEIDIGKEIEQQQQQQQ